MCVSFCNPQYFFLLFTYFETSNGMIREGNLLEQKYKIKEGIKYVEENTFCGKIKVAFLLHYILYNNCVLRIRSQLYLFSS